MVSLGALSYFWGSRSSCHTERDICSRQQSCLKRNLLPRAWCSIHDQLPQKYDTFPTQTTNVILIFQTTVLQDTNVFGVRFFRGVQSLLFFPTIDNVFLGFSALY